MYRSLLHAVERRWAVLLDPVLFRGQQAVLFNHGDDRLKTWGKTF